MEQGSPAILLEIEGETKCLIIDSGSSVSILQPGVSRRDIGVTAIYPYGVTGENLVIQGRQCVSFILGGKTFRHTFIRFPLPTKPDGLLGSDFSREVGADISFGSRKLSLGGSNKEPHERLNGSSKHAVLAMFPEEKRADKSFQTRKEEKSPSKHNLDNPPSDKSAGSSKSRLVNAAHEVATAPKRRRVVTAKYNGGKKNIPSLVDSEPAAIPIQGILRLGQFREQGQ
jgi:hypothetical protein